jgi:alpha-tubulin suppressor-like RCC1 family protein
MKLNLKSVLVLLLLPVLALPAAVTVTNIAAGSEHSLFIKSDGSLWTMGKNTSGQLGNGTFSSTNRPEQIFSTVLSRLPVETFTV